MSVKKIIERTGSNITGNTTYFALFELVKFIVLLLLAYKWNIFNVSTDYPQFTSLFFLITGFVMIVSYYFVKERNTLMSDTPSFMTFLAKVGGTLSAILGLLVIVSVIAWLFKNVDSASTLAVYAMDALIVIGALGLIYVMVKPLMSAGNNDKKSIFGIIGRLINSVKNQYNITTKSVWILLGIEILLIVLRIFIPMIVTSIVTHDGTQLLKDPVYLNNQHTLGNFENLHAGSVDDSKFNYHYSLSAWFYINPQPPNTSPAYTKYTSILNYGDKPQIEFNGLENVLRIRSLTGKKELVEIYKTSDIQYQTWNNVVINYDGGNMDVFINGKLVASRPNIAPYMTYENITSGSDNGIQGGICNVMYYDHTLSKGAISLAYSILKNKDVPLL